MTAQPSVIVFTTSACSWCRAVKDHLKKNGVRFREIDVERDADAAREMVRRTGQQGVPVVLIGGRPIVGFKKDEIDRLLGLRGGHGDH
ncbi:MAG TPA: glutaredoxin domain-containing protein [Candidatus Aminicenantes bacterium]|nr:glutaredoxin domain-containing protein [Candidatus Aminicenantes bacterium]